MAIPFEPLHAVADKLAEVIWHTPAGKRCGLCDERFHARRAAKGIFRGSYSSEAGGFTQSARLICDGCFRHIREHGIPDALKDEAARDIVNTLGVSGPIDAA